MKELKYRNWFSTVNRTFLLIIVMFLLVTTPYIEQKDTMVVIKDQSIEDGFDKDNSIGGERFEYAPPPQQYPNKGKTLQAFRNGSTSSYQTVDEFFNGTLTLTDLDASDRYENVMITPPTGYNGTSGHFNISNVIGVKGNYTKEGLNITTAKWESSSSQGVKEVSTNFTLGFRSNLTSVYVDIVSSMSPSGEISIYNDDGTGKPDTSSPPIAGPKSFGISADGYWDRFEFKTILPAGSYTVVLNHTSPIPLNNTHFYTWYRIPDSYNGNMSVVWYRDYPSGSWFGPQPYDIPLIIEAIAYDDSLDIPRDFTGDPPSDIDFRYNGTTVNSYNQIPMNTSINTHNFTMDTSVNFTVDWLETYENNLNPFNTDDPLAYNITDGAQAYWNTSFTAPDLSSISYTVQDRTFNVTKESDWILEEILQNGASFGGSIVNESTFTTIIAGTTKAADNWTITYSAPNYVSNIQVNDARGVLGLPLNVSTLFIGGYTPTGYVQLSYDNDSLTPGYWNGSIYPNPSPNPYTTNDILQKSWGEYGPYIIESFYTNGTEVGLGDTSIDVYRPTIFTEITAPSSVLKGTSVAIQVRLREDTPQNDPIGEATVNFTAWSGLNTDKTDTNGIAGTSFSTGNAPLGPNNIQIRVARNDTAYYMDTSSSRQVTIIQSASLYGLSYKSAIGYNDSTTIQVIYVGGATVGITIDGNPKSMGGVGGGYYSYTFFGTEWGLGPHQFTINANKPYHQGGSVSGSINVGNNPTELRTTGLYASSVTFPDLQNDSTLQIAYTDTFELSLAYVDLVHNTTTGNASLTFDWMVGELPSVQSGAGGNYTLSIEGTTIGKHTLAINMSQYGHQPQEFVMTFDIVNNPTALSIDPTIPTNRTLSIEYSEEALFRLYIEDTNHTLPLSITPTVNGWTNYSVVESPIGNYSFTFYGDWVTHAEGQPVDIVFQPYGYNPQTFSFTLIVQHRTIIMTVDIEGLDGSAEKFNVTAGESIFVNVQLNYTDGGPVPNVEVVTIFTVGSKSSQGSSPSLALNAANMQDTQLQSFNITGTTDKQGGVVLAFKTTADMRNVQKIEIFFEGDGTNGAVGMEFSAVNIRINPSPSLWDMLIDYWYLTVAAAILIMILIWYLIRLTRRRLVYRVELERKIQRTYDFIMDIVNLDAIIGILRDGTAFYDLMIGEELDPQLYSSFLTALRTYASTTVTARPVEVEDELYAEVVETEEKAHALMGDKESYIASGELISFAFVFTARFDETGQWQSISPITRETALEAVEEIEVQFESEILQFQDGRDLSAIPGDHIYLGFSNILGLDFLKPHLTTRREKGLTKEEQKALKVARDIEALEGQILLQLVAERLIGEGMVKERAIYALQQLRVKGGVETVERRQAEEAARLEEVSEFEESAEEEESSLYQVDDI